MWRYTTPLFTKQIILLIKKNTDIQIIYLDSLHLFENIEFSYKVVSNYILKSNINGNIKTKYSEIINIFYKISNSSWIKIIFELFINILAEKYYCNKKIIIGDVNESELKIIETISLSEFHNRFFIKFIINNKILFKKIIYEELLLAIRPLKEKYPVENINFNNYFKIDSLYIPVKMEENELIKYIKIELKNLPSLLVFKKQTITAICNIITNNKILREKKRFYFTDYIKKYFAITEM